jgi:hypothetical protein
LFASRALKHRKFLGLFQHSAVNFEEKKMIYSHTVRTLRRERVNNFTETPKKINSERLAESRDTGRNFPSFRMSPEE